MATVSKLGSEAHVSNEALKQVIGVREESKSRSETLGREERHGWEPLAVWEKIECSLQKLEVGREFQKQS